MYVLNNAIVVHPFSSLSVFVAMNAHSALGLADTKHILGVSENGELMINHEIFGGTIFGQPHLVIGNAGKIPTVPWHHLDPPGKSSWPYSVALLRTFQISTGLWNQPINNLLIL